MGGSHRDPNSKDRIEVDVSVSKSNQLYPFSFIHRFGILNASRWLPRARGRPFANRFGLSESAVIG